MSLMWPMLLDLTKDECKRILRRLELEAYASMVSAFRAQGELSKDKKKVLQELCSILGISTERHRAEIRRAVNDEKLATIADLVGGCSTYSEWAIEGRRLVPLMPRLVPQTAFTNIANNVALLAAQHNASLPSPSSTAPVIKSENQFLAVENSIKCGGGKTTVSAAKMSPNATHISNETDSLLDIPVVDQNQQMPIVSSPSNVLVLPSGVSFQVKSATNHDGVQTDVKSRKRKRSSSDLSLPQHKVNFTTSCGIATPQVTKNTIAPSTMLSTSATSKTVSIPIGGTPVQFTLTSSTPKLATSSSSSTIPTQKVILVSTSCSNLQSSILQRSLTVPIVKTVTTTGTMASVTQSLGKVSSLITPISSSSPGTLVLPSGSVTSVGSSSPTAPQTTTTTSGLKIIAQTVPVSSGSKFVPKSSAGGGMPPIVVVTKTGAVTGNQSGTRLVNVLGTQASAGRLLNPTSLSVTKNASALVTVGPNGKQTTLLKVPPGMSISSAGGKSNVIVVQKAHVLQQSQSGNAFTISASALSGSQTMLKPTSLTSVRDGGSRHAILIPKGRGGIASTVTLASSSDGLSDKTITQFAKKSTVLADLLQAAGILPDGSIEPAQLTDLSSACVEELKLEENSTDSSLTISSVVQTLQNKETVNVSTHAVIEASTESVMEKTKFKLQKCESGELDPKTGLFGPCPRHSSSENVECETSVTVEKKNNDVSLERKSADVKQEQSPKTNECFVKLEDNVSALRRELLAGRSSSNKKRDGIKLSESKVDKNESISVKESVMQQPGRTYLYRGATYSKGDVASRRKKALSATKSLSPVKRDDRAKPNVSPKTDVVVVVPSTDEVEECKTLKETAIKQLIIENEAPEIGACDEIHFTDESLTAVIEETVVTTDDTDLITNEVVVECFDNALSDGVGYEICQQNDVGLESIEVVSEEMESVVREPDVAFETIQKPSNTLDTQSGSSVFMVSDSTVGKTNSLKRDANELYYGPQDHDGLSVDQRIPSTFINQQGVCEITGIEGGSEMLEIIGSTDDFDSVESKVAALHGENESSQPSFNPVRTKKRKKHPSDVVVSDDLPSIVPHLHGWSRGATALLLRVMKFRGVGRMKGEPSAAHWFLQPVAAEEAPGYYEVVKNPMDFSTIKKKLEMCVYKDVSEFHDDMMLIKSNCEVYNPPEHPARQDCKEVFAFYQVEYDRLMEKWQKAHLFSPQKKRLT